MNDLRDRIAQAIMPIVAELASDLDHAERENRRLRGDLERNIREAARLVDDDERALGMMDAADMIRAARTS